MINEVYYGEKFKYPDMVTGRHKCICCGEFFGIDTDDAVAKCQEEQYQKYLESQYLFPGVLPCFHVFDLEYSWKSKEMIQYLKEHKLEFNNHNKYRHCINWIEAKKKMQNKENIKSFNRLLTKEEWIKLNNCKCEHGPCYSLELEYKNYEKLYEDYKKAGFDVKLEYNCPKCCEKGASEFEFWFRFNSEDEYVISKPVYRGSKGVKPIEYRHVLEFLEGCKSYKDILRKFQKDNYCIRSYELYKELNDILGMDCRYTKQEISECAKIFWNTNRINKDGFNNKVVQCAVDILNNFLSLYEESYKFSLLEYCDLINYIDKLWDVKFMDLPLNTRREIVEKRTLFLLGTIDDSITTATVYGYLDKEFAASEIIFPENKYLSTFDLENEKRNVVFNFVDLIFDIYGQDFEISVSVFEKLLKLLKYELRCGVSFQDIQQTKDLILKPNYIKSFIEGDMTKIEQLLEEYICDFKSKTHLSFVVEHSIPIVWFGDINSYWGSNKKILTIGLNPSEKEFVIQRNGTIDDSSQIIRKEEDKSIWCEYFDDYPSRFKDIYFYKNSTDENLLELKNTLDDYFKNNPYTWFKKNNKLLNILDCSYGCKDWDAVNIFKNTAIHIDIYSAIATTPTWGKLSKSQKEELKNLHLSRKLLDTLNPDIILSSVNREVINEMFADWELIAEYKFKGKNYIRVYKRNNQILINGTNMQGIPFGGIKEDLVKDTIINIETAYILKEMPTNEK